ncbi:hypothetical protein [Agrobacterium vitis]|uniref:hypothetical protein n=1 Tax=Agrobacterium vitis TaxID=373 RepID=UPI001573C6E3|nr:hypothetical protein [Agrobacterium vitis]NSZ19329.1 hypothetical protein [Agrobacterium vitis]QZO06197.1 hypothetical protein K4831_21350 [Agrobacterium vitis]UJL90520.1 hypothetical protein AVF2S5_21385 [Agrobacterium vitis]
MAMMEWIKLMVEFCFMPITLEARARLTAAELQSSNKTMRNRELRIAAGRLAEAMRSNGAQRWQAVKVEDTFIEMVLERLLQLDSLPTVGTSSRNVTALRRSGAAA